MQDKPLNNLGQAPSSQATSSQATSSQAPSSQAPPNASPSSDPSDFTFIASVLQQIAQSLLSYSETCKANPQAQSAERRIDAQNLQTDCESALNIQQGTIASPPLSRRAKRRERYKECCYDPNDTRAFADKDLAQSFENAYNGGNFRDEIRYYHVPAHIVRQEYKLLRRYEQKDVIALFSSVHNELDLRAKLLAHMDKSNDVQDISITQIGESLLPALKLLGIIYGHLNNFKLIHKTMLPKYHNG